MTITPEQIQQLTADVDIVHQIVHGDTTKTVQTASGPVRSLAKLVADNQSNINAAVDAMHTVLTGTTDPASDLGRDGDFYVKTVSGAPTFIYGPKSSGAWPSAVSMIGAQGPQGAGFPWVSVKQSPYNAVGDGVNDDTAEIQAALNSGTKIVFLPAGTYKVTTPLTVPVNVSLIGEGTSLSILDFSASTTVTGGGSHIKTAGSTWTALPDLSVNVTKNDRVLVFASTPSVARGDILCLYNPTLSSFTAYRTYYRAGEMVRVASVSGTSVTIQGSLCDDYLASAIDVYKLTTISSHTMKDFWLKGWASTVTQTTGIILNQCVDTIIDNVKITGCSYAQLATTQCLSVAFRDCHFEEDFVESFAGDYGLVIGNSTDVKVHGGYFAASRHAIAIGGGDAVCNVPDRYINVSDATIVTSGGASAADIHGAAEYITYDNCLIDGGIKPSGDFIKVTNCHIKGRAETGADEPFSISELRGFNYFIANNTIENEYVPSSRGMFINVGGNTSDFGVETVKGGSMVIKDNVFISQLAATSSNAAPIKICNRGYVGTEEVNVHINGNVLRMLEGVSLARCEISVLATGAKPYDVIEFNNNHFHGAGGLFVRNTTLPEYAANTVICCGNVVHASAQSAHNIGNVRDLITFKNNTSTDNMLYGALLQGRSGTNVNTVHATGNTFRNNNRAYAAAATSDTGLGIWYADNVICHDNVVGNHNEYLTVASNAGFTTGETITGALSGATAVVKGTQSTTRLMIERTRTGTFVAETITGATSGQTTTTSATAYTSPNGYVFNTITTAWRGANVEMRGLADSVTSVTTSNTI